MRTPNRYTKFITREAAFFLALVLYLWLRINPALYNQRDDPVFLVDFNFFRGFLAVPGGIVDYLSAFISQLFYFPILGAIVIALALWCVVRLTSALIRMLRPESRPQITQYVPAILLLMLHSHYKHLFSIDLALIAMLAAVLLQLRSGKRAIGSVITFYIGGCTLYYMAGGSYLMFALLAVLYETLYSRRYILGVLYAASAAALPYLSKGFLFLLNNRMAYVHLLPVEISYPPAWAPYALMAFFVLVLVGFQPQVFEHLRFLSKFKFRTGRYNFAAQTVILAVAAGCAAYYTFEKNNHLLLQIDYYARHEQWEDILQTSRRQPSDLLQIAFCTNRALYHTGQLLENLFSFPQSNGDAGLMLPKKFSESAPFQESDFCYELGLINESRHWAYEAVSTEGENPWTLKRMAVVNFLGGDARAADRCLNVLDKTLFFGSWSRNFRRIVHDSAFAANDETMREKQSFVSTRDFIVIPGHPPTELDTLLQQNPMNRMAFEYRIAHQLLTCRLGGFLDHLAIINNFHYTHIPRHIEEAVLSFWLLTRPREVPQIVKAVRPETMQRFREFNEIFAKYRGNRKAAQQELHKRFGDTFWYHLLYNNPMVRAMEEPSRMGGIE